MTLVPELVPDAKSVPDRFSGGPGPTGQRAPARLAWALGIELLTGTIKVWREGRCRMCQRSHRVRRLTRHHLVPQAWFQTSRGAAYRAFRNAGPNVVPLCRPCHDLVDARMASERAEPRRELRRLLTQAEIALVIGLRGERWFDEAYPRTGRAKTNVSE